MSEKGSDVRERQPTLGNDACYTKQVNNILLSFVADLGPYHTYNLVPGDMINMQGRKEESSCFQRSLRLLTAKAAITLANNQPDPEEPVRVRVSRPATKPGLIVLFTIKPGLMFFSCVDRRLAVNQLRPLVVSLWWGQSCVAVLARG